MKNMLALIFLSSSIFAMELDIVKLEKVAVAQSLINKTHIDSKSVFVPNHLGNVELFHGKKGFYVRKDDTKHPIQKYHTDKMVRDLTKEQLQSFLAVGYVYLNQMSNGEYSLKADGRINGGGPLLGTAMYWVTKSLCYAIPVAAVTVTVTATGGAIVAAGATAAAAGAGATAGAAAAAGATAAATGAGAATVATAASLAGTGVTAVAGATTVGAAVGTTAGVAVAGAATATAVGTTAGAVGAGIVAGGLATEATIATAAGVASAGSIAGAVVAIEAFSVAVGTFFGMLPTP